MSVEVSEAPQDHGRGLWDVTRRLSSRLQTVAVQVHDTFEGIVLSERSLVYNTKFETCYFLAAFDRVRYLLGTTGTGRAHSCVRRLRLQFWTVRNILALC